MKIRKYLALALSVLFFCAGCGRTAAPEDTAPSDFVGTEEISETESPREEIVIRLVGFPVNRVAFERLAQEELNRPEEEQYSHGNMTQAEYDRLCAYIESIDTMNDLIDDDLENIVNEEVDRLFNGKCTAQQCADMIQSRAAIYIAERS